MATQLIKTDNATWKDIISELSLSVGVAYTIQNTGSDTILLTEAAVIPTGTSAYHKLDPKVFQSIVPETGLGIWIKGKNSSVKLIVTESM